VIDLNQQLIDLFNKEEMLAFFDFQLNLSGTEPVSGLCKISRPKSTDQHTQYISLLFLIDTPNGAIWQHVNAYAEHIRWSAFEAELPGIETVLSIPHLHQGAGIYFKETAIYLNREATASKYYISNKLYPAILKIMGLRAGELVFWEDLPETKHKTKGTGAVGEPAPSLLSRLKDFFGL
jgi:hypothetical protein